MKRSENVSLAVMGVAAFAATFAGATMYMSKPSTARPAQNCTSRPDGAQVCERRSFTSFFIHGWGSSNAPEPMKTQGAALTDNARSSAHVSHAGIERGGFGATGNRPSFRMAAGG